MFLVIVYKEKMETSSKKLENILKDVDMILLDSHNNSKFPVTLEKKLQNYKKGTLLIDEAVQLIENMKEEIKNLDTSKADKSQSSKINQFIDLLSIPNQKFDQVLYLVEQLHTICAGIPTTAQIHDIVDQEVIYEELEVFDN